MAAHNLAYKRCWSWVRVSSVWGAGLLCASVAGRGQAPPLVSLSGNLLDRSAELSIRSAAVPSRPFSVVGPRGAILGQQDGGLELWLFPWKVFSDLRISALMDQYPVPIDVNEQARGIEVRPDATIITYSHANFTIRQILLAPRGREGPLRDSGRSPGGAGDGGAMILFAIQSVRPMTLTFRLWPRMQRMWPAPSDENPSPEWVRSGDSSGFYILHLNFPDHSAALAMPHSGPGILSPFQEHARAYPLEFVLRFDPGRDAGRLFPLLVTVGNTREESSPPSLRGRLLALDQSVPSVLAANRDAYRDLMASSMRIETPDRRLNEAFSWAVVSMNQLRVETTPKRDEEALTAGFLGSGDSVRPGFGWFFGRDALWSLYAITSSGGFETTRREIEFLLRRQSPEGKIGHEWSQTAGLVDWRSLPYEFAAADSTALLPMAMNDYLRISGDTGFVAAHWESLERAWRFETTHDLEGDGIYSNLAGTAWVENWEPAMPRQEIYLAALDEQASLAFASLARAAGHPEEAAAAERRAAYLRGQIESRYWLEARGTYAFSWNGSAGIDETPTIFPAVAWWDGSYGLAHGAAMLRRWASEEFSTDWGTRSTSSRSPHYDPISYHQGSVWPLFTGWVSLAEYRAGRPLSGYLHLRDNADLTWTGDLGNVTELLSGQFFAPLGRSTAHQLWSSAMVISPLVRGLFGLEWNVPERTLTVTPRLPAEWERATVHNVPFGAARLDLNLARSGRELLVEAVHAPAGVILASRAPGARAERMRLHIPLPDVEASVPDVEPGFGDTTRGLKVLDQRYEARRLRLDLAGAGGSSYTLTLRENARNLRVRAEGAELGEARNGLRTVTISFPPAAGYEERPVEFSWYPP